MTAPSDRPAAVPGSVLCRLDAIDDGEARGFTLDDGEGRPVDILVARDGAAVYGYLNSCPHVGTPLDWTPDRFMAPDGEHLACATHGALFRVADGFCVAGPCAGQALTPVEVRLEDGRVVLAAALWGR